MRRRAKRQTLWCGYRSYTKATTTRRTAAVVLCTPAQPHKGSTGAVPQRDRRAVRRSEHRRVNNAQPTELAATGWVTGLPHPRSHRVRDHIGPHTRAHERRGRRPRPLESGDATSRPRGRTGGAPGRIRRAASLRGGYWMRDMCPRCQLCSDVRARAHFNTHFCRDCGLV